MDVSQIVTGSIPALAQYILAPAVVILFVLLAFICWRSGSSHALLLKAWLFVLGPPAINSETVKRFTSDELDLTHFRYLSGIKVSTLKEAENLLLWARERNIGLRHIRKAGPHIELEKPGPAESLFLLRRRHLAWRFLPFLALVAMMAILLIFTQYPHAIITVISTDRHFTVDKQYAAPLMGDEKFYFSECTKGTKSKTIDDVSVRVLCALSAEPEFEAKLAKVVSEQKVTSWAGFLYLSIPLAMVISSAGRVRSAIEVRKRLESYRQAQVRIDADQAPETSTPEATQELTS